VVKPISKSLVKHAMGVDHTQSTRRNSVKMDRSALGFWNGPFVVGVHRSMDMLGDISAVLGDVRKQGACGFGGLTKAASPTRFKLQIKLSLRSLDEVRSILCVFPWGVRRRDVQIL
jgi:hypothetical protein